jgi:hypothetical protein
MIPGGLVYLINFMEIKYDAILLIIGQILPFFLIFFIPFAFVDELSKNCKLLVIGSGTSYIQLIINEP